MFYFAQLAATHVSGGAYQVDAVYPEYNGTNVKTVFEPTTTSGWGYALTIDSSVNSDEFEPCIATKPGDSNVIGVAWLDTRNSPSGSPDTLYDAYAALSTDGGSTWGTPYRLSSSSSSFSVAIDSQEYLGDWTGCAWQGGLFYYAFPSTANNENQVATIVGLNP
jgi:hypothetical protein